jgi:NAD(P)-dependent dehydrogenase (short-subunit alcohol dehydrogenase family)
MDLELDGCTAAVIGGSSGIGTAVAGVLAEEGCDVAVTYRRSRAGAQQAAADVRAHGRRAWVMQLELGRLESATGAAETLSAQVGSLDVVVLCAGYNVITPFGRISVEEWNAVLDVNLSGAFFALQAAGGGSVTAWWSLGQ